MSSAAARRACRMVAVGVALSGLLGSCGGSGTVAGRTSSTPRPSMTVEFAPGLTEDVYLPEQQGRVPLVVMVPGGAWSTADPSGLAGLAAALSDVGIVAAPAHVRAAADGIVYPDPVEDVLCAVAAAAERVRSRGFVPEPVAVLGHSSGANLAALAVLATADYSQQCGSPPVIPDALIGLSGPYDITQIPEIAATLLGSSPGDDPVTWSSANPIEQAARRPDVPVLLLHGAADDAVPVTFTKQFAEALERAGHPTTVQIVPGADHLGIFRADVAGARITQWLRTLAVPALS